MNDRWMKVLCNPCRVYGRYVHIGPARLAWCEKCGDPGILVMVRPCHKPGQPSKIGADRVKVQVWLPDEALAVIRAESPGSNRAVAVRAFLLRAVEQFAFPPQHFDQWKRDYQELHGKISEREETIARFAWTGGRTR